MRFKFQFIRKRQLVEKGEFSIDIEKIDEEEIAQKLKDLDFKSFLVTGVENASPDQWEFIPMKVTNGPHKPQTA